MQKESSAWGLIYRRAGSVNNLAQIEAPCPKMQSDDTACGKHRLKTFDHGHEWVLQQLSAAQFK